LNEIFEKRRVLDANGEEHRLHSNISIAHSNALYETVIKYQATQVIEIGMAYGISTLAILAAIEKNGGGRLISIDPYQSTDYKGIGLLNVQKAGLAQYHTLIEKPDYLALPELVEQKTQLDAAYIDGWHTFDYTLLDFFFVDKLLKADGFVAFNDASLPAVKKVLRFVKTHRKYEELNVGLKQAYVSRNLWHTFRRIITLTSKADRYFRKQALWEPNWDFYKRF